MCYVHLNSEQMKGIKILPSERWKDIMRQAHDMGMMHAVLTGGECLSYPAFDDIYLFLRSLGIKISIKTNGVLLNKDRIAFFKRYPPRGITVSLYGSCDEIYNSVTGHAVFNTVYSNLRQIKDSGIPVDIAVTPNKYMYKDMAKLLETVKQLGLPYSVNIMLFPPRPETGRELCDLSSVEYVEIYKLLHAKKIGKTGNRSSIEETDIIKKNESNIGLRCGAGRSSFNIDWRGSISACENLESIKISLLDHSFSHAWKIINSDALAYPLPVECAECDYTSVCFGCTAYRNNGAQSGHCNQQICERTKMLVREGIYSL